MTTVFKVYWTNELGQVCDEIFTDMVVALALTQRLRSGNNRFVSMVGEDSDSIGLLGVDAVVNGLLPSGMDYTWKKRRI